MNFTVPIVIFNFLHKKIEIIKGIKNILHPWKFYVILKFQIHKENRELHTREGRKGKTRERKENRERSRLVYLSGVMVGLNVW